MKEKGITMIALVVTISIMVTLAAVTITGAINGGLFEYARKAKKSVEVASETEAVTKATIYSQTNNKYGNLEESELQEALDGQLGEDKAEIIDSDEESFTVKIIDGNRYYDISKDGKVTFLEVTGGEKILTVQCVDSKNTVLEEHTYTILKDTYSKTPPTVEGYEPSMEKITGTATQSTTIKALYYLICNDDTTLVFTPLDSSGNILSGENIDENSIASYMVGDGTTTDKNGMKTAAKAVKSVVYIPDTYNLKPVTSIGKFSFRNCSNIIYAIIGKNVTSIVGGAFSYTSIEKIIFRCTEWPTFNNGVFAYSRSFTKIGIDGNENKYKVEDNVLYSRDGKTLLLCPVGMSGRFIVPDTVVRIKQSAFADTGVTSVVVSEGVSTIEQYAFVGCKSLTEITMGQNVTSVAGQVFNNSSNLTTLIIDSSTIAGGFTTISSYGRILYYATTIYVKDGLTVGSYVTNNFTQQATSDKEGYVQYIKNAS